MKSPRAQPTREVMDFVMRGFLSRASLYEARRRGKRRRSFRGRGRVRDEGGDSKIDTSVMSSKVVGVWLFVDAQTEKHRTKQSILLTPARHSSKRTPT
jgi:hypothetical protein